jgi:hypothetical protein
VNETEALQKRFAGALMPNYGLPPVAISRGAGCLVWDLDGREYLDLIAGIAVSSGDRRGGQPPGRRGRAYLEPVPARAGGRAR